MPRTNLILLAVAWLLIFWPASPITAQTTDTLCPGAQSIAQIRLQTMGTEATVRGVVTVPTGAFSVDRSIALQDATGGIYVFAYAGIGQTLAVGDEVCATGQLAGYHGLLELMPRTPSQIVRLGRATPPAAQVVSPKEVGKANEGRLVTITGIVSDLAERRFRVDGAAVYVYETTGISFAGLRDGCAVTVNGFSSNYNGPQVLPRSQADIVPGVCENKVITPESTAVACPDAYVWQLQGPGNATSFDPEARFRCLEACVTGVTAEGFFVQSLTPDADPRTSEGIYVYRYNGWANPRNLTPGTQIELRNFGVQEFYNQTEIVKLPDDTEATYGVQGACKLPTATPITPLSDPAIDPTAHFEPFEGMRVSMRLDGSVVGPTQRYASRYAAGDPEITLAQRDSPFYGQRILASELPASRGTIGISGALGIDLPNVGTFDRMMGETVTGILAYQFERYVLLIDDPSSLRVEDLPDALDAVDGIEADEFALCAFNVENLFDNVEDGDGDVGDWSPADEAAFRAAMNADARTLRETLQGCTAIGLQEIEGKDAVWAGLAQAAGPNYRYDYFESADQRDITVGLLYDASRVTLRRADQPQACSPTDYQVQYWYAVGPRSWPDPCSADTHPLFDRPPYVADLTIRSAAGDSSLDVRAIVVHLKSKRGEEAANLPRRIAQARFVASLLTEPNSVAMGDFNDTLGSDPLAEFSGRVNLWERYAAAGDRYTYIYQGRGEAIDHFVMTRGLDAYFLAGGPVHVNADFPDTRAPAAGGRSSDHDPLFVRFAFRPTGVGEALVGAAAGSIQMVASSPCLSVPFSQPLLSPEIDHQRDGCSGHQDQCPEGAEGPA